MYVHTCTYSVVTTYYVVWYDAHVVCVCYTVLYTYVLALYPIVRSMLYLLVAVCCMLRW